MVRTPRRGQRSKGIKVKHCIQLTLLLGVGIWLIYQMKHSHEKKAEFEGTSKIVVDDIDNTVVNLGRKDLRPRIEETKDVKDEVEDEEGSKNEGGGDVSTDKENGDEIVEREEEEKAVEENNEKEAEGTGNEEGNEDSNNGESEKVVDESEGGNEISNEEAREINYKGDDASSEVMHGTEEKSNEKVEVEGESKSNSTENVSVHEDESGPKNEVLEGSVIKEVSLNTTENGSDDGEQQDRKSVV